MFIYLCLLFTYFDGLYTPKASSAYLFLCICMRTYVYMNSCIYKCITTIYIVLYK